MTNDTTLILRPMTMGQILDQAVRLYRNNFFTFIGIVALVQVPITVVRVLLNLSGYSESSYIGESYLVTLLISLLNFIFIQGIGTAAMTRAVADDYLGEKTSALEAYRKIGQGWLTLLAALFILGLIFIATGLWTLLPCIGWLTGVGMIFYLSLVITPLVAPIIVIERQSAGGGWRRAWQLARQRFWWVFGFFTVLYIFNLVVVSGPAILASLILSFSLESSNLDSATMFTIQIIIGQLITLASGLVFLPFQLAASTLVYFDLRVRFEGFDLAVRAQDVEGEKPVVAELMAQAPQAAQDSFMTSKELAYFAGLTIIPVGLYIALISIITVVLIFTEGSI